MKRSSICKVRRFLSCGLVAVAVLSSCTDSNKIGVGFSDFENAVISVGSSVGMTDGISTRAFADTDHEALKAGTKLRLKVSGKWVGHTPNPAVLYPVGTAAAAASADVRKNVVNFDAANQFYWDNFGTGDPANTAGRDEGLTVYAVGVDDGTTAAPEPSNWTKLPWTVETAGTNVLTKDLIYSNNIRFVDPNDTRYKYANRSNPIQLDMQHAMSMVTVKILADEGFPTTGSGLKGATTHKFENYPVFKLSSNGYGVTGNPEYAITSGDVNIEAGVITPSSADAAKKVVTAMTTKADDADWTIIQTALVFPGTQLARAASGDIVANLTVDGNEYNVSAEKMRAAMTANPGHNSVLTKPGYNYIFKIKVKKTGIEVEASVVKWINVEAAEQEAKIWFDADVSSSTITSPASNTYASMAIDGNKFNLYKSSDNTYTVGSPSSVCLYSTDEWVYSPQLYWQDKDDDSYFRGLAKMTNTIDATPVTDVYASANLAQHGGTDGDVDVLWGTTPAHKNAAASGTPAFSEGVAILPRTGPVPLMFYHAKSKLTIKLSTTTGDDKVVLTGASVKIDQLSKTATLNMASGGLTPAATVANAIQTEDASATTSAGITDIKGWLTIPQTIGNTAIVTITLADGTKYTTQLNQCVVDGTTTKIGAWVRGTHYIYTFKLTKAKVTVTATLAKWTEVTSTQDVWF